MPDVESVVVVEEDTPTTAKIIQIIEAGANNTTTETWLPKIREYNFDLEDIDTNDTNRDEAGTMHRNILRGNVYHASVVHICDINDMTAICTAIKSGETINVKVLAPGKTSGSAYSTITAYVSKMSTSLMWYEDPENEEGYVSYWQVSYTLVEV